LSKRAVSAIMQATLLIGMLTLAFDIQPIKAESKTWTLDDDEPVKFGAIQEACASRYLSLVSNESTYSCRWGRSEIDAVGPHSVTGGEWNFDSIDEWEDFASVNYNFTEFVVGLSDIQPNSYSKLVDLIIQNDGKLVNTISMEDKIRAVVANISSEKISAFMLEIQVANLSRYIEPNLRFEVDFVPNDPEWPLQWGPAKINADYAWNTTIGNTSVLVAVIDTGIDWDHPDLAANYVALGYDWVNNDTDPMDDCGHGTHCAGIIAAVTNNNKGIAGLAQVQIMGEKGLNRFGEGYEDDLAGAIIHATEQGADIISMSWGEYFHSELIYEALKYAYDSGVLLVAAAGNEATNRKFYPAAYKEVIAVTAISQNDSPAPFTNYGDWIEVAAPGANIYSTNWDDSYASKSGTSMSAAHVSGVAALIWSQFSNVSRDQVRAQLRYTPDDLGNPSFDVYYGYGRINARRAVEQTLSVHDLLIFDLETPRFLQPQNIATIKTTVLNFGITNESNLVLQQFINDSLVNSTIIGFLASGAIATISFSWIPTIEGSYNATSYVVPVPNETGTENNAMSGYVVVRTLKVPERYLTIQEAINVAFSGETIFVSSGAYLENLVVNKTVSLIGENKSNTVIDGNGTRIVVDIVADYVNISGFTIQNGAFGIVVRSSYGRLFGDSSIMDNIITNHIEGIYLYISYNNTIKHNIIRDNTNGICIFYSYRDDIKDNEVMGNSYGLSIWGAMDACINSNEVINNTGVGVMLRECFGACYGAPLVFRNNRLSNNGFNFLVEPAWYIEPTDPWEYFHDVDDSNTVDGKPIYYWVNEHNKQVPANAGYVALINCTQITVQNLNLRNNSHGVLCALTTNSAIVNVNASDNYWCDVSLEFASKGNLISQNTLTDVYYGILLCLHSDDNKISSNTITRGGYGICLASGGNEVTGNTILDNKRGTYIYSSGNILRYNNMTNNTYNFGLEDFIQDVDVSNTVNGKPIYYWVNQHDKQVPPDAGYVALINSTNLIVKNSNLTNNREGVLIAYTNHTIIDGVVASKNDYYGIRICSSNYNTICGSSILNNGWQGVSLQYSNNNIIIDSAVSNNSYGIFLDGSNYNIVSNTTIILHPTNVHISSSHNNTIYQSNISNGSYGIHILFSSCNNIIRENVITNNHKGINLYLDCCSNTIIHNTITFNGWGYLTGGIILQFWSDRNKIVGNNITNNEGGVSLYSKSNDNAIYHNNFIHNTQQVHSVPGVTNTFDNDYPSGGNYWSDYTGVDLYGGTYQNVTGSDGICDTPYVIDENNRDRYPLMKPWGPIEMVFDVVWDGITYPVAVISNSTVNNFNFSQPLKQISFNVAGPDGTVGFCNVTIPKQLLYGEPWTVLIDGISTPPTTTENATHSMLYFTYSHSIHKVQIIGTYVITPPPPLSASISPLSASILVGRSVTFTSTVSGGYTLYSYQWYLNGNPVSGANTTSWTFMPTTSGIYYVYLKVTDAKGNTAQSDPARITVAAVPVGGYSISIQAPATAKPLTPNLTLTAIITIALSTIKRKITRKKPP